MRSTRRKLILPQAAPFEFTYGRVTVDPSSMRGFFCIDGHVKVERKFSRQVEKNQRLLRMAAKAGRDCRR